MSSEPNSHTKFWKNASLIWLAVEWLWALGGGTRTLPLWKYWWTGRACVRWQNNPLVSTRIHTQARFWEYRPPGVCRKLREDDRLPTRQKVGLKHCYLDQSRQMFSEISDSNSPKLVKHLLCIVLCLLKILMLRPCLGCPMWIFRCVGFWEISRFRWGQEGRDLLTR